MTQPATSHPLDPLSKTEIEQTSSAIKDSPEFPSDDCIFCSISLIEPNKAEFQEWKHAANEAPTLPRRSEAVIRNRRSRTTLRATVELMNGSSKLLSLEEIPNATPPLTVDETVRHLMLDQHRSLLSL